MNRIVLSFVAAAASLAASGPARADFASCVVNLRADAAHAGISGTDDRAAFRGLEPDMKVLDFQQQQPEFKTPIWDYVDGLVDEERVSDGKEAMAGRPGARLCRGNLRCQSVHDGGDLGGRIEFRHGDGKRPLVQSLSTLACLGERAGYFRSELMAT